MEEKYLITVITKQEADGERESIELTTHADLELSETGYAIVYSEQDENGDESHTRLVTDGSKSITVTREGVISTYMTVESGKRTLSHHVTPYGNISMGIRAQEIISDMTQDGGRLFFSYATDIEHSPIGVIEFDITLRKKA